MAEPIIKLDGVSLTLTSRAGPVQILKSVDLAVAAGESLAIVGGISLIGMLPYARAKQVDWKSVLFFGLPGMGGTYIGAWLAKFMSGRAQLVLFGVVMLVAAAMTAIFTMNLNLTQGYYNGTIAEKEAEANVIRRREETNATRSLLNTAKVMAENPVMLRLKELEALETIAGKVERLTVHNGTSGLMSDLVRLRD